MLKQSVSILVPIGYPVIMGLLLLLGPKWGDRKKLCIFTGTNLVITAVLVAVLLANTENETSFLLFHLTKTLPVYFKLDGTGRLFISIAMLVWLSSGLFGLGYMKHEQKEQRYFGFFLAAGGVLAGLDLAGNLITFYLFYEMMTLLTMPLVLHSQTREAIMAGVKYLFYSLFGAYLALFGIYVLSRYVNTLTFTAGGVLDQNLIQGNKPLLLAVAFVMLLGFSLKAGLFPFHGWLSTAHPVAPAPASGALSGIIVKSGVLACIRVIYYLFGPDFLRGTWVQTAYLVLILITILMGSMMAYREKLLKKRLAYSTISQVSYILLGLALMQQEAMKGALLHTVFHAVIKCGLFLCAGAMIIRTKRNRVDEYLGIGRKMPVTMCCYLAFSLALIGIPPASGFVSKWYLALGSLNSGLKVFGYLAPAVLLISAFLTAGYLLPIAIRAFLPGADYEEKGLVKKEPELLLFLPIVVLAVLAVGLGIRTGLAGNLTDAIVKLLIPGKVM